VRLRDGRVAGVAFWDRYPTYPVGERVVCIADEGVPHVLKAGRVYVIERVEWDAGGTELVAAAGVARLWNVRRFRRVVG
jgi:hypothetical protein